MRKTSSSIGAGRSETVPPSSARVDRGGPDPGEDSIEARQNGRRRPTRQGRDGGGNGVEMDSGVWFPGGR